MKSPDPGEPKGSAVTPTDVELVQRALRRDLEAIRLLVEKYQQPLYGFALAILGDHHEAQDAAQSTLIEAHRGLAGFDLDRDFRRWVFGIARNLCFDALKKRPRETPIGVGLAQFEDLDRRGMDPPRTGGKAEERMDQLRQRVAQLPQQQRVILALRYLEGLSKAEIGQILGLSYHAVGQRLYRSLKELRRRMAGDEDRASQDDTCQGPK